MPDEPAAVIEYRAGGASPFLLVCDHAGRRIPRRLQNLGLGAADLARHIAWDIGIAGVGRHLADRLDAALIMQPYSRLVIDCNRPPGSEELIPHESDGTAIPGNENLSADEAASRASEIFTPDHGAIEKHLDARAKAKRATILISLHSFTPVYGGVARPWRAGGPITATARWLMLFSRTERAGRSDCRRQRALYGGRRNRLHRFPSTARRGIAHVAIEFGRI